MSIPRSLAASAAILILLSGCDNRPHLDSDDDPFPAGILGIPPGATAKTADSIMQSFGLQLLAAPEPTTPFGISEVDLHYFGKGFADFSGPDERIEADSAVIVFLKISDSGVIAGMLSFCSNSDRALKLAYGRMFKRLKARFGESHEDLVAKREWKTTDGLIVSLDSGSMTSRVVKGRPVSFVSVMIADTTRMKIPDIPGIDLPK